MGVFRAFPGKALGLKKTLGQFIASEAGLLDPRISHLEGHQVPLGGRKQALDKGRVLLVGDAANLADPWLGEGISYTLMSARLAAEMIFTAFVRQEFDLSGYTREVNASFIPQLSSARLFANLVYSLPKMSTELLSRSPYLQRQVFDVLRGNRTFRQMAVSVLLGTPRIVLETLLLTNKRDKQVGLT